MYNIPEEHIELASNILTTLMYWRGQDCEIPDELFIQMKAIGRAWVEAVGAVEEINNKEVN
jgi:hypothetical protein